jgi:signal transduction histidine kinase
MPPSMPPSGSPRTPAHELDERTFSWLTGVRSGKQSYYAELKRTKARLTSAVQALEGISAALVRTHDDPRALLEEVLRAAAGHLRSGWTMIALHDEVLAGQTSRFLAAGPDGQVADSEAELPGWLRLELSAARSGAVLADAIEARLVRVPLTLQDVILGRLIASREPGVTVEHADLWVLQILANQAAVSMHTATLHSIGTELRREAQQLYDEIARSSHDLQARTAELAQAERRLQVLHERELLDTERHRIADELHDSVAQYVLSAGLAVELCRAEAADREDPGAVQRLMHARDLIAKAGDQVRSVVYALHHEPAT